MSKLAVRLAALGLAILLLPVVKTSAAVDQTAQRRIAPSLLTVTVSRQGMPDLQGTALAIARDGWMVTSAGFAEGAGPIIVSNRSIGALSADVEAIDQSSGLALLHAPVRLQAAEIAHGEPGPGDPVSAAWAASGAGPGFAAGALGNTRISGEAALTHNALFAASGYGGPLINDCGQVVGLNRAAWDGAGAVSSPPKNYAIAATIGQIESLAARQGIRLKRARFGCVPALAAAEARARKAEQKAAALHDSKEAGDEEKQAAETAALLARKKADAAEALAWQRQRAAEEAKEATVRTQRLAWWGAAGGGVLLLVAAGLAWWLVSRHRARRCDAETASAAARRVAHDATTPPQGAHDLLLEGRTPEGEAIALKIPALALGQAHGGAVIGRSPDESEFVIAREGISRKHLRLFVSEDAIFVEDLKSTNGTVLNGILVDGAKPIHEGDILRLDDLTLRLSYRDTRRTSAAVATATT